MVVAGKIFRLAEPTPLPDLLTRLSGYRREEAFEEEDFKFTLITEIVNLTPGEQSFTGVFSHDYVTRTLHHGRVVPIPHTIEALFSFDEQDGETFLTVVEKKRRANFIANRLSEIIYGRVGWVLEARISPEVLREFHLRNPEDTKVTFFDNVDIPNVNKLSLYGPDLTNTSLFEEYCRRGDLWYVVARSKAYGYVVGVTRDASVTIFNITDRNRYLEYVRGEIYPMILKSSR